jgi:hypothetical protein
VDQCCEVWQVVTYVLETFAASTIRIDVPAGLYAISAWDDNSKEMNGWM